MVSLKQARTWQEGLGRGEAVRLRRVRAGQHPGRYDIVTALVPGAVRDQEIVLHLDHLRPGANDNASGCATILEVARTQADPGREARAAAADDPLRLAPRDRRDDLSAQRPSGDRRPPRP